MWVGEAKLGGGGGEVHLPSGLGLGACLADVGDDADDAGVGSADCCDAVDGIFVGPEVAGDGFVDDDDGLFGVDVFPGHVATLDEAHANGVEVAGGDDVDEGAGELVGLVVLALGGDSPGAVAGHGERVGDGGGLDAGDLLDAVDDLAVEGGVVGGGGSAETAWDVEDHGGGAGGLEAEIDVEDAEEAAEEEAGADKEDAGEGDLGDDECGAEAGGGLASGGACCRILESVLQIATGDAQARDDAKEEARSDGDEEGPGESGFVDGDAGHEGQGDGALVGEVEDGGESKAEAEEAASGGEDEGFGGGVGERCGRVRLRVRSA